MIDLKVTDNLKALADKVEGFSERRMNSTLASTLTATARDAQKSIKSETTTRLDRPTPFTLNSTYVKPATAQKLEAYVGFKEFAGKGTPAGKYIQPQIHGGGRRDKGLEVGLRFAGVLPQGWYAVPGPSARLNAYGNMSAGEVVRILSAFKGLERYAGAQQNRTSTSAARKGARLVQYFAIKPGDVSNLSPGIYQRRGQGILKVINFVDSVRYRERLPLEEIVGKVVETRMEGHFRMYLERALQRINAKNA
jgi:hypothetical protein